MTHRDSGGMTQSADSWLRLLDTLERIAVALEKVVDLAERASAAEDEYRRDRTTAEVEAELRSRHPG